MNNPLVVIAMFAALAFGGFVGASMTESRGHKVTAATIIASPCGVVAVVAAHADGAQSVFTGHMPPTNDEQNALVALPEERTDIVPVACYNQEGNNAQAPHQIRHQADTKEAFR